METIKQTDEWLDPEQLICTKTDGETKYNFNKFMFPLKFTSKIYHRNLTLQKAKDDQQELELLINKLNNDYNPVNQTKIKEKDDALKSVKKLNSIRKKIINAFKKEIFPYMNRFQVEKETDEETDKETVEETDEEKTKNLLNNKTLKIFLIQKTKNQQNQILVQKDMA